LTNERREEDASTAHFTVYCKYVITYWEAEVGGDELDTREATIKEVFLNERVFLANAS